MAEGDGPRGRGAIAAGHPPKPPDREDSRPSHGPVASGKFAKWSCCPNPSHTSKAARETGHGCVLYSIMMGTQNTEPELFSYQVNLDKRVRANNPLRAIREKIDFTWVRDEVAHHYGYNGNESTDPVVILKLLFLL